jgi:DNA processing protein
MLLNDMHAKNERARSQSHYCISLFALTNACSYPTLLSRNDPAGGVLDVERDTGIAGLQCKGKVPPLLVAIIGTRKPSSAAATAAFNVAKMLAEVGIGVVSGLALGIDAAAHRGCLAGGGRTVAVLGHGLEQPVYPPEHAALADVIARRGALASPFSSQTPLSRQTLLARNESIVALAKAVWVVQTGVPGGALTAAAYARNLGIPVFTTPWDEPKWRAGYDSLLKHGAESVDVLTAPVRLSAYCQSPLSPQGRLGM